MICLIRLQKVVRRHVRSTWTDSAADLSKLRMKPEPEIRASPASTLVLTLFLGAQLTVVSIPLSPEAPAIAGHSC